MDRMIATPSTGMAGMAVKVAASTTIADPGMPWAPLDVSSETRRIKVSVPPSSGVLVAWAMKMTAQVNQILGLKFSIEVTEANTAFSRFRANDMEAQCTGWIGRMEADEYVPECFHSKGPRNFKKYSNPEVDKLIDASRQEFDQAKRGELLKKAEDMVVEEMPTIFTMNNNAHNMWTTKVKGFVPLPSQNFGSQFPPVSLG